MTRALLMLLVLACPLLAAPVPKALKKNPYPLAGEWEIIEWHIDDAQMRLTDDVRWTIDGDNLTVVGKKAAVPDGFQANVRRTVTRPEGGGPTAYDYTIIPIDGGTPSLRPAVVELTGETFKICMSSRHNGPRPAACAPAEGTIMYVLKRADSK